MHGIPALDVWDSVIEVLHSSSSRRKARVNLLRDKTWTTFQRNNEEVVWHVGRFWLDNRLIVSLQTQDFVTSMHCLEKLKTMKQ